MDVTNTNLGDNHLIPSELKTEICALKCLDGWGKVLVGIPRSFSSEHMIYFERINKTFAPVSTLVKKNFKRVSQFLEETYLDVSSIYIKQSEDLYVVKGLCECQFKKG